MARHCSFGVEVILDSDISKHPYCPHGPTLLFEKFSQDDNNGRKFYACSSSRDRKDCGFFRYLNDKKSPSICANDKGNIALYSRDEYMQRLDSFGNLPESDRKFCRSCSAILLPTEWSKHTGHGFLETLSLKKLSSPTLLLQPKEANKSNAQFFFTTNAIEFVVQTLQKFNVKRVICIGAPTIHEAIISRKCDMRTCLLDIDIRFSQFFDEDHYCQYNLFNNHFFDETSESKLSQYISSSEETAIVLDPPFGGLVDVISFNLKKLISLRKSQNNDISDLLVMWFFPYFNEDRIVKNLPSLKMMDYKVNYENHSSFHSKGRKQGSPVRIFTNLNPSKFILPSAEGYKFCGKCKRYVSTENKHCEKCDSCTSKDGRPYKHCTLCQTCVKSSKQHCSTCNHCVLPNHACGVVSSESVCHRCGMTGHKRKECPNKDKSASTAPKRKKKKKGKLVTQT